MIASARLPLVSQPDDSEAISRKPYDDLNQDRETAIRIRAHQLWVESGHVHGRHEQHWHQAEREHASATTEHSAAAAVPAEPARRKAVKAAAPATDALPARKPRKAPASAILN